MAPSSVNRQGHPLSRTYGAILQSSLTPVLPSALVYSTRLPVSVLVRASCSSPDGFSWNLSTQQRPQGPGRFTVPLNFTIRHVGSTFHDGAGMLTCCPSTTPFGLVLGPA